ncbi:HNH endonuclease [Ectopseudomonas mendocina]
MTGYSVLDEAELKPRYNDYKSLCHAEGRFQKVVMFNLLRFHAIALQRFKRKQAGEELENRNLWNEFSNPKSKKKTEGVAATVTDIAPAVKPKRKRGPAKPVISDIKGAFRSYIEKEQKNQCCYCRRWLCNSGYSKPIEHILPRKTYEQYSFHFWNLSVACVDCNALKNEADWASPDKHGLETYPKPSAFTEMFHPRFHRFDEHVRFIRVQTNDHSITLYRGITPQGQKLCDDLLTTIAGKEVIVNANAALKTSMETIERFDVKEGSKLEAALKSLHGALSYRAIELLKR